MYDPLLKPCRYTGITILRLSNSGCRVRDSGYENPIGVAAHNGDKKRLPCSNVARFPFPFLIHPSVRMNNSQGQTATAMAYQVSVSAMTH